VVEGERTPFHQRIRDAAAVEAHAHPPLEERDPKRHFANLRRQPGAETEPVPIVPHAAETLDERQPRPRGRRQVDAVAHVVLQVAQVHERGLAQVVVGELHVSDLRGHHRLRA